MNPEKIQALESAIAQTTCAVGAWSVYEGDGYVQLVWTCGAASAPEGTYGDEPWADWGGNTIIGTAGVPQFDESGCDGYVDRYGEPMVAQWVQWNDE